MESLIDSIQKIQLEDECQRKRDNKSEIDTDDQKDEVNGRGDTSCELPKSNNTDTSIKICIQLLSGRHFFLTVSLNSTVQELKLQIEKLCEIPLELINGIVYGRRQLEDNRMLIDYGIFDGTQLHLLLRHRGGWLRRIVINDLPRKLDLLGDPAFGVHMKTVLANVFTAMFRLQSESSTQNSYSMVFFLHPSLTISEIENLTKLVDFLLISNDYGNRLNSVVCHRMHDVSKPPTLYFMAARDRPPSRMTSVSFATGNRLHLLGHNSVLRDAVLSALDGWYTATTDLDGIVAQTSIIFTQLKLDSKWDDQGLKGNLRKIVFLLNLLDQLKLAGYRLHVSIANNRGSSDLFFIELGDHEEQQRWGNSKLSMMTLNGNSSIRIFGYDSTMIQEIKNAIEDNWEPGLKSHGELKINGNYGNTKVWEFELNGLPWWKKSDYLERSPMILMEIFKRLAKNGCVIESAFNFGVQERQKPVFLFSHRVTDCFQFLGLLPTTTYIRAFGASRKILNVIKEAKVSTFGVQLPASPDEIYSSEDEELISKDEKPTASNIIVGDMISLPPKTSDDKAHEFLEQVLATICLIDNRVIGSVCLTNLLDDARKNEPIAASGKPSNMNFEAETIFVAFSRNSAAMWFDDEP